MGYRTRTRQCEGCGKSITGQLPPTKPVRCLSCNLTKMTRICQEQAYRSGPSYEKAARTQLAYWTAEVRRIESQHTPTG